MTEYIPVRLRRLVSERAGYRCEYCLLSESEAFFPQEPDHVIAVKHAGETAPDNLALACLECNRYKGTDIAAIDPLTRDIVRLFDPRRDRWPSHFHYQLGAISGRTPQGRATAKLLRFNSSERVERRRQLYACGRWRES